MLSIITLMGNGWISISTTDRVYYPNSANASVYEDLYARWEAAYPPQLALADQQITTSMWRAPGE